MPYVLANCAISLDGCLDDASNRRLVLSHADDFDRVDALRAEADAILVGANTIRRDDPRLLVRAEARVAARLAAGRPGQPCRVTITRAGDLDPRRAFFSPGPDQPLVYVAGDAADARAAIGHVATVVAMPPRAPARWLADDLESRGIARLLVEGGAQTLTWFLEADAVDELRVAVAPFFVADPRAVRVVNAARLPFDSVRRMPLARVEHVGDMMVGVYQLRAAR